MLVLSRKEGQKIRIANGLIVIKVLDIKGGRVRLGFTAPGDIPIMREEIELKSGDVETIDSPAT